MIRYRPRPRLAGIGSLSLRRPDLPLLGALLVLSALFIIGAPLGARQRFSLGATDRLTARDFELAETSDDGRGFRWTNGDSALILPPQSAGTHLLNLTISAPRPDARGVPLTITINGRTVLSATQPDSPRRYAFLVPGGAIRMGENVARLQSETFRPPADATGRTLGVVVFDADWRAVSPARWIAPAQVAALALVCALLYGMLVAAGVGAGPRVATIALFLAIALAMRHSDARFVYRWNALWTTLALAPPLALAWWALRRWPAAPATRLPWRDWAALHWRALAGYALATALMLFPLLARLPTHVVGGYGGDNYEYLWKMQWFSDALLMRGTSPVFAPQVFFPTGADLTISEITPANTLLGLPLTALFGHVVSYNALMLASFALTGFTTYLLAQRLGAPRGAAFVAGLIFAFSLRRYYHASGHFGMMGTHWLPLALYGWEGVLTRRRAWDGFVCGLGLTLAAWSTLHYGATLPLFIAAYTPLRMGLRRLPTLLQSWRPALLAGALFVVLVAPQTEPYIEAQRRGETYKHSYSQLILHSARLSEYVLPNPYHPLWGDWARPLYRLDDGGEHTFGLGYSVLALALAGIWIGRRRPLVWALVALIAVNVVMSLGAEWRLEDGSSVPLPARFVYLYAPVLGNIRVWSRMGMYVVLCCALLASIGLAALPLRWRAAGWALASALVLFELYAPYPLSEARPRPVDVWLGSQPNTGAVAEVPLLSGGASMYATLFTGKATNQGTGKFPPSAYREAHNRLRSFPGDSALRLMRRWGTRYVVVHEAGLAALNPAWREQAAREPRLREAYHDGTYSVYTFEP